MNAWDWFLTNPADPSGGYLSQLFGGAQPPSSPIVPGMIPNPSSAGMGGLLGLGQTSPAMGLLGGAARGYRMGGGPLGAVGGAIGGLGKAAATPWLLSLLGL